MSRIVVIKPGLRREAKAQSRSKAPLVEDRVLSSCDVLWIFADQLEYGASKGKGMRDILLPQQRLDRQ